jgi:hypothetical protein
MHARLFARAVVSDHDLESAVRLASETCEHTFQVSRAVISGKHHTYCRGGTALERLSDGGRHAADFASTLLPARYRFVSALFHHAEILDSAGQD